MCYLLLLHAQRSRTFPWKGDHVRLLESPSGRNDHSKALPTEVLTSSHSTFAGCVCRKPIRKIPLTMHKALWAWTVRLVRYRVRVSFSGTIKSHTEGLFEGNMFTDFETNINIIIYINRKAIFISHICTLTNIPSHKHSHPQIFLAHKHAHKSSPTPRTQSAFFDDRTDCLELSFLV